MVRATEGAVTRRRERLEALEGKLRRGPLREDAFPSRLHDRRVASWLGIALGITFTTAFLTGWLSHLIQNPAPWFEWPSRPAGLYRITQGLHVATGIASIPLLLAKLWTVYPRLWQWPPVRGPLHLIERLTIIPLVAGSLVLLATGVANIAGWYPWPFFFIQGHYAAAWITIGALIIHAGAKLPVAIRAIRTRYEQHRDQPGEGLDRRGLLRLSFGAAGLLTLLTVGQTVRPLRRLALLATRDPAVGPQGIPINRTAVRAAVTELAQDPGYTLTIGGDVERPLALSLEDLRGMPQTTATLPIACVEGWSAEGTWRGVAVAELLELAGAPEDTEVLVESMEPRGPYRTSTLNASHASDQHTVLAMELNSEPLDIDHGFPLRLIGPNRPGVMNTKWVGHLEVRA